MNSNLKLIKQQLEDSYLYYQHNNKDIQQDITFEQYFNIILKINKLILNYLSLGNNIELLNNIGSFEIILDDNKEYIIKFLSKYKNLQLFDLYLSNKAQLYFNENIKHANILILEEDESGEEYKLKKYWENKKELCLNILAQKWKKGQ